DKYVGISDGRLYVYLASSPSLTSFTTSNAVPAGRWTHIALVHDATSNRLYIDGQKAGEALGATTVPNSTAPIQIGHLSREYEQNAVAGFYSELRFSSVARYTGNFTPAAHLANDGD